MCVLSPFGPFFNCFLILELQIEFKITFASNVNHQSAPKTTQSGSNRTPAVTTGRALCINSLFFQKPGPSEIEAQIWVSISKIVDMTSTSPVNQHA
jgi:hypothetical protein